MNRQTISILGCGWLGLALGKELVQKGYQVHGSCRSNLKTKVLEKEGIHAHIIDIGHIHTDVSNFLASEVLVIAITSKNLEDFQNLVEKIVKSEVKKVLFVSSTSVYPFTNGIVTEENGTNDSPLVEIERLLLEEPSFETTILRFGGLFGYDRKPGNFIKPERALDNPDGCINFIHRDDCVQIIEQIIAKDIWNEVLNACSESHPTRREFYLKETAKLGRNITFNEKPDNKFKIISSKKLVALLNYQFKFSDLMNY